MAGISRSTKKMSNMVVVEGKRGKRIGRVHHFVFHPTEKRVVGFTVKRPDAALMFHRKDAFVGLGRFTIEDNTVVVADRPDAMDKAARKALSLDWDRCILWVGMPLITEEGDFLGYVDDVDFDELTGAVNSVSTEEGAANNLILGHRLIPVSLVRGFKRGQGISLSPMGEYAEEEEGEKGAILVDKEASSIGLQGGAAAAAAKATVVVGEKAKKGGTAAKAAMKETADRAKPTVQKVVKKTGKALEGGAFAAGKQLGKASGMFAAFKEEFDKASRGDSQE